MGIISQGALARAGSTDFNTKKLAYQGYPTNDLFCFSPVDVNWSSHRIRVLIDGIPPGCLTA